MSSPVLPQAPLPPTYKVVVGIDYSESAKRAVQAALDLALYRDSQIYAITVAEGRAPGRPTSESAEMEHAFHDEAQRTLEKYLAEQLDLIEKMGARLNRKRVAAAVDFGKPVDGILSLAEAVRADLIVVGTRGLSGLERLVLGSVASAVLRGAHCPVLIIP